jgi:hypothetical protein
VVTEPPGDEPDSQWQATTRGQDLPNSIAVVAALFSDQRDKQPLGLVPAQYV